MPKCTLYMSDETQADYQKIKKAGGNPSALFAKALKAEILKRDENSRDMDKVKIKVGKSIFDSPEGDIEKYEVFTFVGKLLASGTLNLDPQLNELITEIQQSLYATRKGNYLLYEEIFATQRTERKYRVIEKNKPIIMSRMAPEIIRALESGDDGGTFLDV